MEITGRDDVIVIEDVCSNAVVDQFPPKESEPVDVSICLWVYAAIGNVLGELVPQVRGDQ